MAGKRNWRSLLWLLLPIALAAPFVGGMAVVMASKGEMLRELLSVAIKLVVVP